MLRDYFGVKTKFADVTVSLINTQNTRCCKGEKYLALILMPEAASSNLEVYKNNGAGVVEVTEYCSIESDGGR